MLLPLSFHEQDYAKSFQAVFMKSHRIMYYCCAKNLLIVGFSPAQNDIVAAIWEFCFTYESCTEYGVTM